MRKYVNSQFNHRCSIKKRSLFPEICDPIPQTKELNSKCYLHESVVDCNRPTHETRAKLSCAPLYEDFNLKQNPYRICKDGTWDTPLPKCIAGTVFFFNLKPSLLLFLYNRKNYILIFAFRVRIEVRQRSDADNRGHGRQKRPLALGRGRLRAGEQKAHLRRVAPKRKSRSFRQVKNSLIFNCNS